jgi:predicted ATPase
MEAPPVGSLGPYQVLSLLGRGGMGVVYLAQDPRLGRRVAVKLLPADLTPDPDRVRRFEQEARAASSLNHPNIVTIHDIGESDAGRYIAMELVEGRTLRALPVGGPPALEIVVRLGEQIARALAVAHAAGIVHRDVKPENLMVREDGLVKVLDFGLARLTRQQQVSASMAPTAPATELGTLLGTTRYMSPEQTRGERVDSATDVFSLGLVLYELATGCHPFAADTTFNLLHNIVAQVPLAPSRADPTLPTGVDALLLPMLDKDPRRRPTAAEAAEAMAALVRVPAALARVSPTPRARRHTVGRESERAELRAAFEQVASGTGVLMCVAGEPGIGKTTLVEEFLGELTARGEPCRVARGRCSERLAGTEAYLPVLEALDSLLRGESSEPVARVMQATAPAWYAQSRPPSASDPPGAAVGAQAASQERMKRELATFLQETARLRPLVLFFDDVHWADASTIELLAYLATKFDEMRLLVLATYRPTELLVGKHPFLSIKLDLEARGLGRELLLPFLPREDIERYLALEFPNHRFPSTFAALIHARTEGSPLFMVDVIRYLRDRRVIVQEDDDWTLTQAVPDIDLPASIRSMIQRKIDQLADADRRLLMAASVQGYEFEAAVVARALAADVGEVEERLDGLDRVHGFVRRVRELELPAGTLTVRYRFVHVLYQNALYASLAPTRKAALSSAVAEALVGFYGDQIATIASQVALLFEAARDIPRAVDQFLLAAQHAAAVFANQEAALLARRGLDLLKALPAAPERTRQELKFQTTLGVALRNTQGFGAPEVGAAYARALELSRQTTDEREVIPALRGLWEFYELRAQRADLEIGLELADRCLHLARNANDPELLLVAHDISGDTRVWLGEFVAAREHLEQAIALYDPQRDRAHAYLHGYDTGVICWMFKGLVLWYLGYLDGSLESSNRAVALAKELSHPSSLALAQEFCAWVHQHRRDPTLTRFWAEADVALCEEQELSFFFLARAKVLLGWALAEEGRVEDGRTQIQEGIAGYRTTGAELEIPYWLSLLAEAQGRTRQPEEALRTLTEAMRGMQQSGTRFCEAELHRLRGELLLQQAIPKDHQGASGSPDPAAIDARVMSEAGACFCDAIEIARRQQAKSLELRAVTSLSRLLQRQGRRDEACQMLARIYGWFTEGFDTADLKDARVLLDQLS